VLIAAHMKINGKKQLTQLLM